MAANPILALGIVAGLLWGVASYVRGRDVKRSMLSAVLVGMPWARPSTSCWSRLMRGGL